MRLGSFLFSVTLAAGLGLLALPAAICAQEPASGVTALRELPEAPQPQFDVAEVEPLDQHPAAGKSQSAQKPAPNAASNLQAGSISGTAITENGDLIPGATVILDGPTPADRRTITADDNGFFVFDALKPGISYRVTITAPGFESWLSPVTVLTPGQYAILTNIRLKLEAVQTTVKVYSSTVQIATEQVMIEEQQRILGIIPNFYVVYDKNPAPLTAKLKFHLVYKVTLNPISFLGMNFLAGIDQATRTPDYVEGAKGYGQRLGAEAASGFSDILIGGGILPVLLHQDPRYYYLGEGTKKARALHALSNPFICKGDNGRLQPNFSSVGGDLGASALSNLYYPAANRGIGLTFENFGIDTAEREATSLIQEFVLRKFTHAAKQKSASDSPDQK